jgi:hypothetical protein
MSLHPVTLIRSEQAMPRSSTPTAAVRRAAKPAAPKPVKPLRPVEPATGVKPVEPATAAKRGKAPTTAKPAAAPRRSARVVVLPVEPVADVIRLAAPTRSTRRRGRSARTIAPVALGSLTQPGARTGETCDLCGTTRVTTLALMLTDGTPVRFTSCHACEHRSWVGPDGPLDRATVLERTRKVR